MPFKAVNPQLVTCPLNPKHIFQEDQMQKHINKCKQKYPNHVSCPYNVLHKFQKKEDLLAHLPTCTGKQWMHEVLFGPSNNQTKHGNMSEQPFHMERSKTIVPNEDEQW